MDTETFFILSFIGLAFLGGYSGVRLKQELNKQRAEFRHELPGSASLRPGERRGGGGKGHYQLNISPAGLSWPQVRHTLPTSKSPCSGEYSK